MAQDTQVDPETAVLRDVTWEQYKAVLDAWENHPLRHHFAGGNFELKSRIDAVSWQESCTADADFSRRQCSAGKTAH